MPSRKKAKGQARKAAKVKNEAVEKAIIRQELVEEIFRGLEEGQIHRLRYNNQSSALPSYTEPDSICMHGFNPFPNEDICINFICAFVREFYKFIHHRFECRLAGREAERGFILSLSTARDSTKDEYSEVWNSADKMKQVMKYFLYNGTMNSLDGKGANTRHSAILARFFEEWLKVKVHKSQAFIDWPKVVECGVGQSDEHTLVKYFWRRIRCSCLDEKYNVVKSMPKMGICFNPHCARSNSQEKFVERSELKCCSRCRSVTYCSRECQAADWLLHKEFCEEVVATKAEFDTSQQQQS
jgi:hypothetical protein